MELFKVNQKTQNDQIGFFFNIQIVSLIEALIEALKRSINPFTAFRLPMLKRVVVSPLK